MSLGSPWRGAEPVAGPGGGEPSKLRHRISKSSSILLFWPTPLPRLWGMFGM